MTPDRVEVSPESVGRAFSLKRMVSSYLAPWDLDDSDRPADKRVVTTRRIEDLFEDPHSPLCVGSARLDAYLQDVRRSYQRLPVFFDEEAAQMHEIAVPLRLRLVPATRR